MKVATRLVPQGSFLPQDSSKPKFCRAPPHSDPPIELLHSLSAVFIFIFIIRIRFTFIILLFLLFLAFILDVVIFFILLLLICRVLLIIMKLIFYVSVLTEASEICME